MSIAITTVPDFLGERSSQSSLSMAKIARVWEGLISALPQMPCLPKYLSQKSGIIDLHLWPTE